MTDTPSRGDESGVSYSGDDRTLKGRRGRTDTAPSAFSAVPTRSPLPWPARVGSLGSWLRHALGAGRDGAGRQKSPICGATSPRQLPHPGHYTLTHLTMALCTRTGYTALI